MVPKLNNILAAVFLFFAGCCVAQQDPTDRSAEKDYKDGEQFEKFYKRRRIVGSWQINELKNGALVVKLKTNSILINALKKKGDEKLAEQTRLEAAGINVNIIRAFRSYYTFSKVYFIYSNAGDSLLNGVRENIFLDSNLLVDPKIKMEEKFYLIAQVDRVYNSSIGFVPEDSARFYTESGTSNNVDSYIVIKNKYGHQLKKPFPYANAIKMSLQKYPGLIYIGINGTQYPFNVGAYKNKSGAVSYKHNGEKIVLSIPKYLTFERLANTVELMNENFYRYYQGSPPPVRIDPLIQPFLY